MPWTIASAGGEAISLVDNDKKGEAMVTLRQS
jgi:hypothetical protein